MQRSAHEQHRLRVRVPSTVPFSTGGNLARPCVGGGVRGSRPGGRRTAARRAARPGAHPRGREGRRGRRDGGDVGLSHARCASIASAAATAPPASRTASRIRSSAARIGASAGDGVDGGPQVVGRQALRVEPDTQPQLGDAGGVDLLFHHLRHAHQRDAVVQRLHRRAHPGVRHERRGVAQHRGLREPRSDVDVGRDRAQVVPPIRDARSSPPPWRPGRRRRTPRSRRGRTPGGR